MTLCTGADGYLSGLKSVTALFNKTVVVSRYEQAFGNTTSKCASLKLNTAVNETIKNMTMSIVAANNITSLQIFTTKNQKLLMGKSATGNV